MEPGHVVINSANPQPRTLAIMGRTARDASDTWTLRKWAAHLAAKAPPRDYRAQLGEIYHGILDRWRYVQEPEEWIHGSADSLIRHVLATEHNAPGQDPTRLELASVPNTHKGFGDCDDIATLVAAAARAVGMDPYFRVARGPAGAHVSVLVRTPAGELVSVDPVGHPKHPFGWALDAPEIRLFGLDGGQLPAQVHGPALGNVDTMPGLPTYYSDFRGVPFAKAGRGHWAATPSGDRAGPRALALPMRMHRLFKHGVVVDGCPAFDERGNAYTYNANRDLWEDERLNQTRLAQMPGAMGGIGDRRRRRRSRRAARGGRARGGGRARRKSRRQKRRATIRRAVSRVAKPLRKVQAAISKSKLVQGAASSILSIYGVPPALTRGVLQASGELFERGGLPALVRALKKDPKLAAKLVAKAAKAGVQRGARGGIMSAFSGPGGAAPCYALQQGGRVFPAQPVVALAGVPGLYEFGALDVTSDPTPGQWYRIQRGDNLLKVAERAWGDRGTRLKHSKWINAVNANAVYHRPTKAGFEANQYGSGIISFNPRYSDDPEAAITGAGGNSYAVIFIPEAPGDEPPEIVPDVVEPDVEPEDEIPDDIPEVDPDEVEPDVTPDLPPEDPVEPIEPDVDVTEPDVVEPAVPTDREKCEDAGGFYVPTKTGHACVQCPPGQRWDFFQMKCTGPGEDPVIPDIPDCPPGTHHVPGTGCVPDMIEPDLPIEPDIPDVIPDVTIPDVVIPDVVEPDVEPDPGDPWDPGAEPSSGKIPVPLLLGVAAFLLGDL